MADETPAPLSDAEIAAIVERAAKATPGPWHGTTVDSVAGGAIYGANWSIAKATIYPGRLANNPNEPGYLPALPTERIDTDANAAFIAAARTDIPRLLATIDAMRAEAPFNAMAQDLAVRLDVRLAALEREHAAMREIVAAVADVDPALCPFYCVARVVGGADRGPDSVGTNWYEHATDCPVTRARALLATPPATGATAGEDGEA